MAKTIDFTARKKPYINVKLADETVLMIGTPTKAIMTDLIALKSNLETVKEGENTEEAINGLYEACARVMSLNKAGKKITAEYLSELMDIEDIMYFFNAYMEFVVEVSDTKN